MGKVKEKWYEDAAEGIDYELTEDLFNFFTAWQQATGGRAKYNPFNTENPMGPSTNYNKAGVQSYTTHDDGVKAFVETITNGRYDRLLKAIKEGAGPYYLGVELDKSPWGTNGWLLIQALYDNGVRN